MVGKRRKKALHKDFWQEIRKSRARFISIFCIVALGVAFFSGIQAASPDMRLSGDAYYNEASLMDLKVMATLGLTEDDVKAIQSIDGVESAEGAYSTDAICGENEKQKVLRIYEADGQSAYGNRRASSGKKRRVLSGLDVCRESGI